MNSSIIDDPTEKLRRFRPTHFALGLLAISALAVTFAAYLYFDETNDRALDAAILRDVAHNLHWYVPQHGDVLPPGARKFLDQPIPAGVAGTEVGTQPEDRGISWIADLMPYQENAFLYGTIDFRKPWDDPVNSSVVQNRIVRGSTDPHQFAYQWKKTDSPAGSPFVGIAGLGVDSGSLPPTDRAVGAFGFGRQTKLTDISDGLVNTMIVVMTSEVSGHWLAGDRTTVRGLDPARLPYVGKSRQFGRSGGVAALFADGSVRWIKDSVSPRVFEAMATIHGGETVRETDLGTRIYEPEK